MLNTKNKVEKIKRATTISYIIHHPNQAADTIRHPISQKNEKMLNHNHESSGEGFWSSWSRIWNFMYLLHKITPSNHETAFKKLL